MKENTKNYSLNILHFHANLANPLPRKLHLVVHYTPGCDKVELVMHNVRYVPQTFCLMERVCRLFSFRIYRMLLKN